MVKWDAVRYLYLQCLWRSCASKIIVMFYLNLIIITKNKSWKLMWILMILKVKQSIRFHKRKWVVWCQLKCTRKKYFYDINSNMCTKYHHGQVSEVDWLFIGLFLQYSCYAIFVFKVNITLVYNIIFNFFFFIIEYIFKSDL